MSQLLLRSLIVAICVVLGTGAARADRRVALVIGNGAYLHADTLANPLTDAHRMRDKLQGLGFDVVYGENLEQRAMQRIIGKFASAVEGSDVALVYFAGHGATFGDTPYVVPVDAEFSSLENMPYELVPVETLIGELRRSKGIRIAILDACRDNAAERELKRVATRGLGMDHGLAPVKNPDGLIIAYGTGYRSTAADGEPNGDSPFTAALLNHIGTPGIDVKEMFFKTATDVIATTKGQQRPEISISLYDSYSLNDGSHHLTNGPVEAHPQSPPSAERAAMIVPKEVIEGAKGRLSGICQKEDEFKSVSFDRKTAISFTNRTNRRATIFWLDYDGKRKSYGTLNPGQSSNINTFMTHPWVIADAETGRCMNIYLPSPGPKHVDIRN